MTLTGRLLAALLLTAWFATTCSAQVVFFLNNTLGWASGTAEGPKYPDGTAAGGLFRTTDGGTTWNHSAVNGQKLVTDVRFPTPQKGLAIVQESSDTWASAVYRSSDGGKTWQVSFARPYATLVLGGLSCRDSLTAFFSARGLAWLYRTTDGGLSWDSLEVGSSQASAHSRIFFKDSMIGWFSVSVDLYGGPSTVYKTTDGGTTWNPVFQQSVGLFELNGVPGLSTLFCGRVDYVYHGDIQSRLLRSTDEGQTWKDLVQDNFYSVCFASNNRGWLVQRSQPPGVSWQCGILGTTDGGSTWTTELAPQPVPLYSLTCTPEANAWAVGTGGLFLSRRSQDGLWRASQLGDFLEAVQQTSPTTPVPFEPRLYPNFPNPFNPSTTIRFSLPHRSHITLTVFNTLGQLVATLLNADIDAGSHAVQFNASNLASGVYFYRLQVGGYTETRKLCVMK